MSKPDKNWTVDRLNPAVHVISFREIKKGWKQSIMLYSDRHHDNLKTNQQLEIPQLDEARDRNAPTIDIGDFFCAMQGRYDPRASQSSLRPEHRGDNYFDLLLDEAEEFYAPYADLFTVIGKGNHESSVLKRNQIDLTRGISRRLSSQSDGLSPYSGTFAGWVFLRFYIHGTRMQTIKLKYHHGHGGGGEVTKGVIQTNRRAVFLPDADIIATGHIHEAWVVPIRRERVNRFGTITTENQWHIQLPTYKEEYIPQDGFHIEKGRSPRPLGAAWLDFSYEKGGKVKVTPVLDIP